jgi:hypothetical protein
VNVADQATQSFPWTYDEVDITSGLMSAEAAGPNSAYPVSSEFALITGFGTVAAPEPSSFALFGGGVLALVASRRSRRLSGFSWQRR